MLCQVVQAKRRTRMQKYAQGGKGGGAASAAAAAAAAATPSF